MSIADLSSRLVVTSRTTTYIPFFFEILGKILVLQVYWKKKHFNFRCQNIKKIRDSSLVALLILHLFYLSYFSFFKTVGMIVLPAKPSLASMAEHDVTDVICGQPNIRSETIFNLMCKKEYARGYWKFRDDQRSSFRDIAKRLEGGGCKLAPTPTRARVDRRRLL